MNTELAWFKSSYSGGQDEACVEVAVEWRKSSYSGGEGEACVEIATCPDAVHVRDSKDPSGPSLAFTAQEWSAFVAFASRQPITQV
jgi:hypothetical protein